MTSIPSSSIAFASTRMPIPLAFSVRKSSSIIMTGKRNLTGVLLGEGVYAMQSTNPSLLGEEEGVRKNANALDLRQRDTDLALILAATVFVGGLADIVRGRLQEYHLRDTFIGIDFRRQRCRV